MVAHYVLAMATYIHVCHASGPAKGHLKRAYVGPASNDSKVNNIYIYIYNWRAERASDP